MNAPHREHRRTPWQFPLGPLVVYVVKGRYRVRFDRRDRPTLMVGEITLCSFLGHSGVEIPPTLRKAPGLRFRCKRCGVVFG